MEDSNHAVLKPGAHGTHSGRAAREKPSLHTAVSELAADWSIELTPREVGKFADSLGEHLPPGTRVYVTWLAGSSFENSLAAAVALKRAGMIPVPHLAARAIKDEIMLSDMLAHLRGEADVTQVLLVGGTVRQPAGAFDACIQVLETGAFERHGIRKLGLAAHPEGSPDIAPAALAQALTEKNAYAARSAMAIELTTQFCFDAAPILDWECAIRAAGNRLPVTIGLAGLAGIATLIKHARNCGVGNSIGVLMKQAGKFLQLTTAADPSSVILGLARARLADSECRIARLHYFPFGAFQATARYARALAEGDFTVDEARQRLQVRK